MRDTPSYRTRVKNAARAFRLSVRKFLSSCLAHTYHRLQLQIVFERAGCKRGLFGFFLRFDFLFDLNLTDRVKSRPSTIPTASRAEPPAEIKSSGTPVIGISVLTPPMLMKKWSRKYAAEHSSMTLNCGFAVARAQWSRRHRRMQ